MRGNRFLEVRGDEGEDAFALTVGEDAITDEDVGVALSCLL